MEKIVLGMSGGVDSTAAVSLLRERGFEVYGVFLTHGALDSAPALRAAEETGVPLEIVDISAELEEYVCRRFESEYLAGRTPSPCIYCNPAVKFPALCAVADRIGAKYVATGHYARTEERGGYTALLPALCENDQSYMLSRLPQEILSRCVFPLGELTKDEVRELAERNALSSAKAADSMEICFIPSDDYGAWLEERGAQAVRGEFISTDGTVLGEHEGLHRYTVGKRRGLRVAAGERLYVKLIDPETGKITLAKESEMYIDRFEVSGFMRLDPTLADEFTADVKVRHSRVSYPGTVKVRGDRAEVLLADPIRIPAPGQFAAMYAAGALAASGIIEKV